MQPAWWNSARKLGLRILQRYVGYAIGRTNAAEGLLLMTNKGLAAVEEDAADSAEGDNADTGTTEES